MNESVSITRASIRHGSNVDRPSLMRLFRSSFTPLIRVYTYLVVLLPSGSIFGVNVKMLCFALLLPSAVQHLLGDRHITTRHWALLLAVPAVLALWVLIALLYGSDTDLALTQYRELMVTLASCWIFAVYYMHSDDAHLQFLRTVLHAEAVASFLKLGLLVFTFLRGIPVSTLVNGISDFFGVQLMGLDFESSLGRIQFVSDYLIPICFYILLCYRKQLRISITVGITIFSALALSLAFTFSRFFWLFAGVALALAAFRAKKDRFHTVLLLVLGTATLAVLPLLIAVVQLRADVAGGSDDIRTNQMPALVRFFYEAPLFGHGFGSHTTEVIRNAKAPYVYEVQIYALAGQLGMIGMLLLGLILLYYFHPLWPDPKASKPFLTKYKLDLLLLLLFWLSAGFFNPMLVSSAAAVAYATLKALIALGGRVSREGLALGA